MSRPLPATGLNLKRGEAAGALIAWGAFVYGLVKYHCH